jgi:hypothetical protein
MRTTHMPLSLALGALVLALYATAGVDATAPLSDGVNYNVDTAPTAFTSVFTLLNRNPYSHATGPKDFLGCSTEYTCLGAAPKDVTTLTMLACASTTFLRVGTTSISTATAENGA